MSTPSETDQLREKVIEAIRTVHDPEIPVNVYDLGLIYEVAIDDAHHAHIKMTLTTPNCPVAELLPQTVQSKARAVSGIDDAIIELVWEPAWSPAMMSEDAKLALDYDESAGLSKLKKNPFTSLSVGKTQRRLRENR